MLQEELNETAEALKKWDLVESVDWLIDIIFVAIGTMHKLWLSSDKITACRDEVCRSNDSKIPFTKWEDGKVKKWPNYTRPDLDSILSNIFVNCEVWDPFGKSIKELTYSKEEVTQRLDAIKKNI